MLKGSAHPPGSDRYRYLPILSMLLVMGVVLLLVLPLLRRPPAGHRSRVAAFSAALRLVREYYAGEADESALYEGAMRGMVESLDDPHSAYLDSYQVQQTAVQTRGEFGGIGVYIEPGAAGAVIVEVQQDGPAMAAGVEAGDLVTAVDGKDCAGMPLGELVTRIRGKIGSSVELTLQHSGTGETVTVPITRARITLDSVSWRIIEPGIGYINIRQFDEKCADKFKEGLEALGAQGRLEGLIVDLRGNTGGLLRQAVDVSDLFLSEGVIAQLESRLSAEQDTLEARPEVAVPRDVPLAVLVDGGTASAAEVFAGSLQEHGRAVLIGTATFGKGSVNRVFGLPDGSGLFLTVAHYTVGSGRVIEGKGIEPDIEVGKVPAFSGDKGPKEREEWLVAYRTAQEEQFQRAVQFIKQKTE